GFAVFFTRFRRCAADPTPSCSPASELCSPLRIRRRVARLSRAIGRGPRSTGTCSPAIGGAASALAAKAALDAARGLCATGPRCPPCSWRAATPRSESTLNDFRDGSLVTVLKFALLQLANEVIKQGCRLPLLAPLRHADEL